MNSKILTIHEFIVFYVSFGIWDDFQELDEELPNWDKSRGQAYWVAHKKGREKVCEDLDYDDCLEIALKECQSESICRYVAVPTTENARNEYGYNLYKKSAGRFLKDNVDWNTFKKRSSNCIWSNSKKKSKIGMK